jgi:lysylphosphatidylglycerol synthetase-like protein (DUF2156 family)
MHELKDGIKDDAALLVKRLGNSISTVLLHSSCRIFQIPQVDGIIGYQSVRNCVVVIGDPICLPQDIAELTQAFHLHCQKCDLKIVYFLASDSFAHWAINNGCQTLIQVGEELFIDPVNFTKNQKLRAKINRSVHHGVVIKEYTNFDPSFENQMKDVIEVWQKGKRGPQVHLGDLNFFVSNFDKRIFYALQKDKIVGLLALSPVDRFQGWVVSLYLALACAPTGTTEHLLSSAFDVLASENCHFCSLGIISGSQLGEIIGLTSLSKFFAHRIFKIAKWYFSLYGKSVYLYKYHPESRPTYLLLSEKLTFLELMAIKQTVNVRL